MHYRCSKPFLVKGSWISLEWFEHQHGKHIDLSSDLYINIICLLVTRFTHSLQAKKQLHCPGNSSKTLKWSYSINWYIFMLHVSRLCKYVKFIFYSSWFDNNFWNNSTALHSFWTINYVHIIKYNWNSV